MTTGTSDRYARRTVAPVLIVVGVTAVVTPLALILKTPAAAG
ncbi:hypothetical protein [Streptomyces luteireticuli]